MSDVLQLATKYRARLKAELTKVDDFLRMAEELSKSGAFEAAMPAAKAGGEARANGAEASARGAAPAKAEANGAAEGEGEAPAKPAAESKTPFDRFRASGG